MDERDDTSPRGLLFIVPESRAARRDAGVAGDTGHFSEDQSGTADRTRSVVNEVEIAVHTLFSRIHAHRRYHGAIGKVHLSQAKRLEQRRNWLLSINVKAPR